MFALGSGARSTIQYISARQAGQTMHALHCPGNSHHHPMPDYKSQRKSGRQRGTAQAAGSRARAGSPVASEPEPSAGSPSGTVRSSAHTERVAAFEAGQRIDNFLMRRAGGVPRSHVYQIIRKGEVRVDGRRVKPTRKLREGEQVRIPPLQLRESGPVQVPDGLVRALIDSISFEHEDFFAIDKPAGVAVHAGSGLAFGVIDALRQHFDDPKLELVHRLDRATSGCLLIARDPGRNRALQTLFRKRTIDKRYEALVAGHWPVSLVTIDAPLLANREQAGERRVIVSGEGQQARTHIEILESFDAATRLDVRPVTGRTHQIRVHALHAGHAVIGDQRYGDNRMNRDFRRQGLSRLFLHSRSLAFDWHDERVIIDVPPADDWQQALVALRSSRTAGRTAGKTTG